jgi:hypothetical protein
MHVSGMSAPAARSVKALYRGMPMQLYCMMSHVWGRSGMTKRESLV